MLFYLHYCLMTSGLSGTSVLLAVFFKTYTDASQSEIGALLMTFPFVSLIIKPLFCSMADRHQAHRLYLLLSLLVEMLGYTPFLVIPFFPNFYTQFPRLAWYVLVVACHVGNGGLGVAWSLGDCLAVNYSQKTGTPFGRMRLMGTLSWGVYGFIIGQINELPQLPKYLPAFIILHLSLILELAMVFFWNKDDFVMVDPLAGIQPEGSICGERPASLRDSERGPSEKELEATGRGHNQNGSQTNNNKCYVDSLPSSLGGTLRINPKSAGAFRDVLAASESTDELTRRLKQMEVQQREAGGKPSSGSLGSLRSLELGQALKRSMVSVNGGGGGGEQGRVEEGGEPSGGVSTRKNPQLILLKMILVEDGRVLKYALLFTIFGVMMAPMNFIFLSMEEVSRERGYNFSQLAGAVLISQALIETVAFFVTPWCMNYVTKWAALSAGLVIMSAKYFFYAGWYYDADMSPYWAVLAEWSHGISYGIFCTIQADVSLMFANQSRLFIGELRRMGFLSSIEDEGSSKALIEAEENSIKMALRATMSSLFSGLMDGLGAGSGALICGIFIEMYSYVRVWQIMAAIASTGILAHLLIELTRSRWSDRYRAKPGTKAHEIMQLSKAAEAKQREQAGRPVGKTNQLARMAQLSAASASEKSAKEGAPC